MKEEYDHQLNRMLEEVGEDFRRTSLLTGFPAMPEKVEKAMRSIPRHAFVPDDLQWVSYQNLPLPIGYEQTISQPFIVALMTSLINPKPDDVVLEIGTGSGYQAAVLSKLVSRVYSIELSVSLAKQARMRLKRLGFDNVEVRIGDGNLGWPEHAPYDAILVTAAAHDIPPALTEHLKSGGTLVIPLESGGSAQDLMVVKKDNTGKLTQIPVMPVVFVPLRETRD